MISFATSHRSASTQPPSTNQGAPQCPAPQTEHHDAGDDTNRDIDLWSLVGYCDGTFRFAAGTVDAAPLSSFWVEIDSVPGGCGSIDRVVVGHVETAAGYRHVGDVVATPTCDQSSWTWLDSAGSPVFNEYWLQLDFRGSTIGAATFTWTAHVRSQGDGAATTDRVPNAGAARFPQ